MPTLLMTRPMAAAKRFTAMLSEALQQQLTVLYSPLLEIRPVPGPLEVGAARGLIFTSLNGVAAADGLTRSLPAYCVGEATALAARQAGWQAEACGGTADALTSHLLAARPDGPLLHLRGAHARGDVAARLTSGGLACAEQTVYDQRLQSLTEEALAALLAQASVIAPLFSPRSAAHFSKLCPAESRPILLALSPAVAEPLKALNYKDLQICRKPTAEAMAQAVQVAAGRLPWVESGPEAQ